MSGAASRGWSYPRTGLLEEFGERALADRAGGAHRRLVGRGDREVTQAQLELGAYPEVAPLVGPDTVAGAGPDLGQFVGHRVEDTGGRLEQSAIGQLDDDG